MLISLLDPDWPTPIPLQFDNTQDRLNYVQNPMKH
jgi:hypothetical protein